MIKHVHDSGRKVATQSTADTVDAQGGGPAGTVARWAPVVASGRQGGSGIWRRVASAVSESLQRWR